MCSCASCMTEMNPKWLLVIETVIPDNDRENLSKLLDLEMFAAGSGKERTAAE